MNTLLKTIAKPKTSDRNEIGNYNYLVHKRTHTGTVM